MLTIDDCVVYGLRVHTRIPLPQAPLWNGEAGHIPDLEIIRGPVPERLSDLVRNTPFVQVSADGRLRLNLKGVMALLIEGGRRITVETALADDAPDLSTMLLGPALGMLLHQRGLTPLHGACVAIHGRAVVIAGPSGAGKSTLAAALLAEGHRLLADDLAVFTQAENGDLLAVPGYPQQRLWRDALEALAISPGRPIRTASRLGKFERRVPDLYCPEPLPVAAVCHLAEADPSRPPGVERLTGVQAFETTRRNIYRFHIAASMTGMPDMLERVAAIVKVPQYRLRRPTNFAELTDYAAALPDALGLREAVR
ncbi:MAG: hypothetical protein WCJ64_04620 [Rhodospirillaceae bacterium]